MLSRNSKVLVDVLSVLTNTVS